LEARIEEAYPVLHVEMGPVWTGVLQAVFPMPKGRNPPPAAPVGAPGAA
jgi:hypothetical protein